MGSVVKTAREGSVLVVRLCSPENRNALSTELREQLGEAVDRAEQDPAIRAVFLTGDGPTFCSGGDMKMMQAGSGPWPVHRRFRNLSRWLVPLITLDKPVVVGVRGAAVGGGMGLALTGDVVVAGEGAKFIAGFFRIGLIPDIGTMYHLPRLIGMARAKNFIFSGGTMSAKEAHELGLVAKLVPDDQVEAAGMAEALRLAEGPSEVIGLAKTLMARSFETSMADMFTFEEFGQILAYSSTEFREALSAAQEGRRADFAGSATAPATKPGSGT